MTVPIANTTRAVNIDDVAAVSVTGVRRTYGVSPSVEAVRDASFTLHVGELATLAGPSGCGKSTLLGILGLLDRPTAGSYKLAGTDTALLNESERTRLRGEHVGFVFQRYHLLEHRTVAKNVELGLRYGLASSSARSRDRIEEIIRRVGLLSRIDSSCNTLSGGEQQRVAIARALVKSPGLLLCDEPTGNLDSRSSAQVLELIQELTEDGVTTLIVTHDETVAEVGSRRFYMRDGVLTGGR